MKPALHPTSLICPGHEIAMPCWVPPNCDSICCFKCNLKNGIAIKRDTEFKHKHKK